MQSNQQVIVSVPATTANLGPGFDCLGMALDLYNQIYMSFAPSTTIEVEGQGANEIKRDEENIVWQAARRVFTELGQPMPGIAIKLVNQIPTSRGLGSSAAAIVGGLVAANNLAGNKLSQDTLLALATEMEGHPDNVAPALLGGIVISVVSEGKVHYLRIDPPEELSTVVAIPDFELSTQAAREVLPRQVSLQDAIFNLSRSALMVGALCQKRLDLLTVAAQDVLHQPHRAPLVPGLVQVIENANRAGALSVMLSGAGPTVIAFTHNFQKEVAGVMEKTFLEAGVICQTKNLKPIVDGAVIL
ncbi:homoserine kinase [Desulforamulus aeronauticus]|uniref:Homoserine kinase n=1 Tax=Desulforamulus aeronauticus DSM 10349 TaxID=1121421 RepID=A0A1M6SRV1_9FIRM|nr:homoserine kinase [Desulforamulus aeronauticus]SHK47386.1 homoserine kinase [Desulforamulus aeronauticus DSM 10349]